jgi:hypothetical protein
MAAQTTGWRNTLIGASARALLLFFIGCLVAALVGSAWLALKFGVSLTAFGLALGWLGLAAACMVCIERRLWLPTILIVLALRVAMFLVTDGVVTSSPDPHYYDLLARELSQGRDYTDVIGGVPLRAHAPRLYSILLAGLYLVTDGSRFAPFILNGLVDSLTGLLIFTVGRQLGAGLKPAAAMGVLYVIWPHIVVSSAFAQKEGLACLLMMACVWILTLSWADGRNRGVLYGLFLGLIGLSQPAWFPMVAGFPLAVAFRHRAGFVARFLAVAAVASILVLSPWIIRNWSATGGFIPLTSSFGWNLFANAARTTTFPEHLGHLSEAEWSRELAKAGIAIIAANPLAFAVHEAKMIAIGLALEHGYYLPLMRLQPSPSIAPKDFLVVMQLPLIAMWAGGAWCASERKGDGLIVGTLALALLYIATIGIWFEFGARHRAFLLPIILSWVATVLVARPRGVLLAEPA